MTVMIEPPNSVVLVVGREEFTPPSTFEGQTCVATGDCIAISVINVYDAPTMVTLSTSPDTSHLLKLGEFVLETEGFISVRDVYNQEHQAAGVPPGVTHVTVWGSHETEPHEVALQIGTQPSSGDDGGIPTTM